MTDEKQEMEYKDEDENCEAADLVLNIKKIKEQLKQCQKEKQEYLAGWQRSQADFINYKRRQEEQLGEWLKMSSERVLRDILPIVDTLDSFSRNNKEHEEKIEKKHIAEGVLGVRKQLMDILSKNGIEEIKTSGEKFNPEFHEAVEQVESDGKEGRIVEEVQKGYLMNGKVLRPAKVKVTK